MYGEPAWVLKQLLILREEKKSLTWFQYSCTGLCWGRRWPKDKSNEKATSAFLASFVWGQVRGDQPFRFKVLTEAICCVLVTGSQTWMNIKEQQVVVPYRWSLDLRWSSEWTVSTNSLTWEWQSQQQESAFWWGLALGSKCLHWYKTMQI